MIYPLESALTSSNEMLKWYFIGALAIVTFLIAIISCLHSRTAKVVSNSSTLLAEQKELNARYIERIHGDVAETQNWYRECSSKQKYDRTDCDEVFNEEVLERFPEQEAFIRHLQENQLFYEEYLKELKRLVSTMTPGTARALHVSYQRYRKVEKSIFETSKLQKPVLDSSVICTLRYTPPKGQNVYTKSKTYSIFQIESRHEELLRTAAEKQSVQNQRKAERAKMTPSIRYRVLSRDGFRCQICGARQEDGVQLHVDHIIPVSKGGKTEMQNLRTLCDLCNLGKGDRLE